MVQVDRKHDENRVLNEKIKHQQSCHADNG